MNIPVASYSFLNTWHTCPHQAARKYIIKDLGKEPESPEMSYGNLVHKAFENRLKTGQWGPGVSEQLQKEFEPFAKPLDDKGVKPEQMLGITSEGYAVGFWDGSTWLRGKLDAPVVGGNTALVFDWKTGKVREDPFELEIQALLLKARYTDLERVYGQYVWLKDGKLGEVHDCSDVTKTFIRVHGVMDQVKACTEIQDFPKTPGALCGWCPVTDCQHNRRGK